jgi:hypothetical protein
MIFFFQSNVPLSLLYNYKLSSTFCLLPLGLSNRNFHLSERISVRFNLWLYKAAVNSAISVLACYIMENTSEKSTSWSVFSYLNSFLSAKVFLLDIVTI